MSKKNIVFNDMLGIIELAKNLKSSICYKKHIDLGYGPNRCNMSTQVFEDNVANIFVLTLTLSTDRYRICPCSYSNGHVIWNSASIDYSNDIGTVLLEYVYINDQVVHAWIEKWHN